ncbi:hypothetical protein [Paenarthrobacter sp. PH39-S1]|uniref:hypothetical protein n=1 Tax=Paenarthrobacter sp. PH39-S1 TaxID=3046204 RepID=UPI0024B8875E|nr:hypothetical protein [Paenarthrobacter sp. PH39-S1]MDJ0356226.1 hypothetical protein [Paenarthrobacter sp. PH39-S1]
MWMLIRANALGAETSAESGARILAACPDSAERGDPWRWTIELNESAVEPAVRLEADESHIAAVSARYEGGYTGLFQRGAGEQLIVAALTGEALVAAENGPWERWLRRGDVFIVEGEDPETLRLSLPVGDSAVQVITLAPTKAKVLRWVP